MTNFDSRWLPEGHVWDLHIERLSIGSNLSFDVGGWKLVWHTTETPWDHYDAVVHAFAGIEHGKAPHFLIGGVPGSRHPYVAQFVPLDEASFALRHPAGTKETNRAHCIQIEICGYAAGSQDWPDWKYKALANLFTLIDHRRNIANVSLQDFSNPYRFGEQEFVDAYGHVGHSMVPNNDHWDPGRFRADFLIEAIRDCPVDGGWDL